MGILMLRIPIFFIDFEKNLGYGPQFCRFWNMPVIMMLNYYGWYGNDCWLCGKYKDGHLVLMKIKFYAWAYIQAWELYFPMMMPQPPPRPAISTHWKASQSLNPKHETICNMLLHCGECFILHHAHYHCKLGFGVVSCMQSTLWVSGRMVCNIWACGTTTFMYACELGLYVMYWYVTMQSWTMAVNNTSIQHHSQLIGAFILLRRVNHNGFHCLLHSTNGLIKHCVLQLL